MDPVQVVVHGLVLCTGYAEVIPGGLVVMSVKCGQTAQEDSGYFYGV